MTNPTFVVFREIWDYNKKTRIFDIWTPNRGTLWVESFENGIAVVTPAGGSNIVTFAAEIAGCFHEYSNFGSEVLKAFNCVKNVAFIGIQFEFNGATVLVTKENADADKIYEQWETTWKANVEKSEREREEYKKTDEYRMKRAKALKAEIREKNVSRLAVSVDEATEIEFKDEEAANNWKYWVEVNSKDGYSRCVVTYACRWAKFMQYLMDKHNKTVADIADNASLVCDIEGITGFMHGTAVAALSSWWKYGEELRRWHNKKWGRENIDGVVNPAVLTVTIKE